MKKGALSVVNKRRQQLTRQLVMDMLGKRVGSKDTDGLLKKLTEALEKDIESTDPEIRHKAMDKIIKLLPYTVERNDGPSVQVNVQNNTMRGPQITAGKTTSLAIDTMQGYLEKRNQRLRELHKPEIKTAEFIDVEMEDVTDGEETTEDEK